MTRSEIISAVRIRLNEVIPNSDELILSSGFTQKPLDALIDGLLDASKINVLLLAPLRLLPSTPLPSAVSGSIYTLPDDFIRLIYFRLGSWLRGITVPISKDSVNYRKQFYIGGKSGKSKPVAAWTSDANMKPALELFPGAEATDSASGFYVKNYDVTNYSGLTLDAIILDCAVSVLAVSKLEKQAQLVSQLLGSLYSHYADDNTRSSNS